MDVEDETPMNAFAPFYHRYSPVSSRKERAAPDARLVCIAIARRRERQPSLFCIAIVRYRYASGIREDVKTARVKRVSRRLSCLSLRRRLECYRASYRYQTAQGYTEATLKLLPKGA